MSQHRPIKDFAQADLDVMAVYDEVWGEIEDLWTLCRHYRQTAPVTPGEMRVLFGYGADRTFVDFKHYSAFGYDEVAAVLADPATFANGPVSGPASGKVFGRILLTMDPPEHTAYRRVLQAAFAPKMVKHWIETLIRPTIHELLDELAPKGRGDLVAEFTRTYPFIAIFRLLGLPQADVATFQKLALAQILSPAYPDLALEAGANLNEYFTDMIEARRRRPGDDFISTMMAAEVDGERLPQDIAIAFLQHILQAAADTTYKTTGSMLTGLLRDPAQIEAVRGDRALVPAAIEEALRWDGPVTATRRMVMKPTVLGGVQLEANTVLHVVVGSANHDDERFPDPERFDVFRDRTSRHFGFGSGPHVCVGMHLARLQMNEALNALLDRLPNLRLDPERDPPAIRGVMMRGPRHINVLFGD